jgi:hypothetical protein
MLVQVDLPGHRGTKNHSRARYEARLQAATPEAIDRYLQRVRIADSFPSVFEAWRAAFGLQRVGPELPVAVVAALMANAGTHVGGSTLTHRVPVRIHRTQGAQRAMMPQYNQRFEPHEAMQSE